MPADSTLRLLDVEALERSSVVANNAMNRDRGLSGVNSYARDLGRDPYEVLTEALRARPDAPVTWIMCAAGPAARCSRPSGASPTNCPTRRSR
ncbi:hypothetical protein ACTD5D_28315 [Nocardia takedensis]|uniref:hypothetical protein n=1 Tax=Nocardia takedensis TaxID=259390 RepID=UPI003F770E08